MKKNITLLTALMLCVWANINAQVTRDTLYVDPGATSGANNGASWTDAYTSLSNAVTRAIAIGNTDVWVKQGTYRSQSVGNPSFITIGNGLHLYGGFNGTEGDLSQRDPKNNLTTLDGDVNQNDITLTSLNDALNDATRSDNVFSVIEAHPSANGNIRSLKVDGFAITGGNSNSTTSIYGYRYGGGIYVRPNNSSSTSVFNLIEIENCIFENNSAHFGSVILTETPVARPALTIIENCIFRNNFSTGNVVYAYANNHSVGTLVTNCLFTGNTVTHASSGLISSGCKNSMTISIVSVINSTFSGNNIASGNLSTLSAPMVPGGDTIQARLGFYNSIIDQPTVDTILLNYGGGVADNATFYNNVLSPSQLNLSSNIDNIVQVNNSVGQNPGFVGNGNYELTSGSAALNHGVYSDYVLWYNDPSISVSAPAKGLGGNLVPTSGNINAGAYQGIATGIEENRLNELVLNMYPNPAKNQLNIELSEATTIRIVNLLGEAVLRQRTTIGQNTIDISSFSEGIYFMQFENKGAIKFIKQ